MLGQVGVAGTWRTEARHGETISGTAGDYTNRDLMLIHSSQPWEAGKLGSIGVSNFLQKDLENIIFSGTVVSHANQLLVHVGNILAGLIPRLQRQIDGYM